MARTTDRPPPRQRLLDAADELFYAEGVQSIGIDRVIAQAGVAKASLYSAFGSKDALVEAYLGGRSAAWRAHVDRELSVRWSTAEERLLGVFDLLGEWFASPGYHGCPFINANAEARPGSGIETVSDEHRAWVRSLFAALAGRAGARDPDALAHRLALLYDGSMVAAQLDRDPGAGAVAREAAAALLVAARAGAGRG
jgi:AcrR family transcriptional regulator